MTGAIIGDIVGSRFEFNNTFRKDFRFFTDRNEFTDDTVMTCAVAKAITDCGGDYSVLPEKTAAVMREVGQRYPYCGYGARFIDWMFCDDPKPYNSCGNGSAMRVSPAGFAAKSLEEAIMLADCVTAVTHNHPEGMKGAEATAAAIYMARTGSTKAEIKEYIESNFGYDLSKTTEEWRRECRGHGREICQVSVPQAFSCFLEGEDYEDVIRNCISIGGDSDTIAAIAGGIAEAFFGVPEEMEQVMYSYLDGRLSEIVRTFREKYCR